MEELNSVNAEQEMNVESQDVQGNNESVNAESLEAATPEVKTVQSAEENAKYAQVRREAEQRAKDAVYSNLYGDEYGIYSEADYIKALERQQAIDEGKDPEVEELKQRLNEMESKENLISQADQMSKDPKTGELFKQWKPELDAKITELKDKGLKNVDYETAFTLMAKEKIADLMPQKAELKKEAIKEYLASVKSGQVPVEGAGTTTVKVDSPAKTFSEARNQALQFMRSSKEFKI